MGRKKKWKKCRVYIKPTLVHVVLCTDVGLLCLATRTDVLQRRNILWTMERFVSSNDDTRNVGCCMDHTEWWMVFDSYAIDTLCLRNLSIQTNKCVTWRAWRQWPYWKWSPRESIMTSFTPSFIKDALPGYSTSNNTRTYKQPKNDSHL